MTSHEGISIISMDTAKLPIRCFYTFILNDYWLPMQSSQSEWTKYPTATNETDSQIILTRKYYIRDIFQKREAHGPHRKFLPLPINKAIGRITIHCLHTINNCFNLLMFSTKAKPPLPREASPNINLTRSYNKKQLLHCLEYNSLLF